MRNTLLGLILLFGIALIPQHTVRGASEVGCEGAASTSAYCQGQDSSGGNPIFGQNGVATKVAQVLAIISGIVSVVVIVMGGISYITSSGNPQKTASAKNTILFASIGLVVSLMAQAVVSFILSKL